MVFAYSNLHAARSQTKRFIEYVRHPSQKLLAMIYMHNHRQREQGREWKTERHRERGREKKIGWELETKRMSTWTQPYTHQKIRIAEIQLIGCKYKYKLASCAISLLFHSFARSAQFFISFFSFPYNFVCLFQKPVWWIYILFQMTMWAYILNVTWFVCVWFRVHMLSE